MAETISFSRNTKLFLKKDGTIWELPLLDGFSFSQATNTTEVTLNEMSKLVGAEEVSRRGRALFTDSLAPAEWSFSTYMRPNDDGCVEEALLANFIAKNAYVANAWTKGVTKDPAEDKTEFDFESSNVVALGDFELYFVMNGCGTPLDAATSSYDFSGKVVYKLDFAVVNTMSIDFEIDGIATLNFSGFAKTITELSDFMPSSIVRTGIDSTGNFIRNRLTSVTVVGTKPAETYNITLTGGSISFENNMSFLVPEELCKVNIPLEHVTGTRSITGNFTCYLDSAAGGSSDLFLDLATVKENLRLIRNSFALTFSIGGSSKPKVVIALPNAHIEVPTHSIEEVISLDVAFHALAEDFSTADEATITYYGPGE